MDCSSASEADRVCEWGEEIPVPEGEKADLFHAEYVVATERDSKKTKIEGRKTMEIEPGVETP